MSVRITAAQLARLQGGGEVPAKPKRRQTNYRNRLAGGVLWWPGRPDVRAHPEHRAALRAFDAALSGLSEVRARLTGEERVRPESEVDG